MAIVELRNVSKRFRKGDETITPLDDVSLDLSEGDFLSLMGPSGTGKSTLLNLVSGIDRPDSGTIVVNGTEITRLNRGRTGQPAACGPGHRRGRAPDGLLPGRHLCCDGSSHHRA